MLTGNLDASYEFPEYESHIFHCLLDENQFNDAGVKLSKPRIVKYQRFNEVENAMKSLKMRIFKLLHDPRIDSTKKSVKKLDS